MQGMLYWACFARSVELLQLIDAVLPELGAHQALVPLCRMPALVLATIPLLRCAGHIEAHLAVPTLHERIARCCN